MSAEKASEGAHRKIKGGGTIAAEDRKLLMTAGIPRVIHVGVRLSPMEMMMPSPRMMLLNVSFRPREVAQVTSAGRTHRPLATGTSESIPV